MKYSFTVVVVYMAVLVQSEICRPRYKQKFDVLNLQLAVERCGPASIVDTCHCGRNQLRWTQCLYDDLKLVKETCPQPDDCVTLSCLYDLFKMYSNNGRSNCPPPTTPAPHVTTPRHTTAATPTNKLRVLGIRL